jgi:hypothetical protein
MWRGSHPFISDKHQSMTLDGKAGFARQRYRFERLPTIQIPPGETVPVKMPGIVRMPPRSYIQVETFLDEGLNKIPVTVDEKRMGQESCGFNFRGGRLVPDRVGRFKWVFIRVQQQKRRSPRTPDEGLVSERDNGIQQRGT